MEGITHHTSFKEKVQQSNSVKPKFFSFFEDFFKSKNENNHLQFPIKSFNSLTRQSPYRAGATPARGNLAQCVKFLINETRFRIAVIGLNRKSILINTLLLATSNEEKHADTSKKITKAYKGITNYQFSTPCDKESGHLHHIEAPDSMYSSNESDSRKYKRYDSATAYAFNDSSQYSNNEHDLKWEIGEISETFFPDEVVPVESGINGAYRLDSGVDEWNRQSNSENTDNVIHSYLLPTLPSQISQCFDIRHGKVPELIITFFDYQQISMLLWELHEYLNGKQVFGESELPERMRLYRYILKVPNNVSIPLQYIKHPREFVFGDPDILTILGKTYRFMGLGNNLEKDRLYIREKLSQILADYSYYISNILIRVPSQLLENNREIVEISCGHLFTLKMKQLLQHANIVIIVLDENGLSGQVIDSLRKSGWLSAFKTSTHLHKALFLRLIQEDQTSYNMYQYSELVKSQYKMLLTEESIEINVVNKIIDETYILEVRPFMCQYPGENQQKVDSLVYSSGVDAVVNYIRNSHLAASAEPLKQMSDSWVEQQQAEKDILSRMDTENQNDTSDTHTLVSTLQDLSLKSKKKKFSESRTPTGQVITTPQHPTSHRDINIAGVLEQLSTSFQERFSQWKQQLLDKLNNMDLLSLNRMIISDPNVAFFHRSQVGPSSNYNVSFLESLEDILHYCWEVLQECVSLIQASEEWTPMETSQLSKLLEFCENTHISATSHLQEFKNELENISGNNSTILSQETLTSYSHSISDSTPMLTQYSYSSLYNKKMDFNNDIKETKEIPNGMNQLYSRLKLVDVAEQDLLRAIRCILLLLNNKHSIKNKPLLSLSPQRDFKSSSLGNVISTHQQDAKEVMKDATENGFVLSQLFQNTSKLPLERFPHAMKAALMAQLGNSTLLPIKKDNSSQFRSLSYHIYGTEEAYSVIRLLVLSEIVGNSSLYSSSVEDGDVQTYVQLMAKEDTPGDEITLQAFANFFGVDILLYSPYRKKPVLICALVQAERVISVAFLKNHFQPVIAIPSTQPNNLHQPEKISENVSRLSLVIPGTKKHLSVKVLKEENALCVRRVFVPMPLTQLCINTIVKNCSSLPTLEGWVPEELVDQIIQELISSQLLNDSILARLLDISLLSLNLSDCHSITSTSTQLIAATCSLLQRIYLNRCPKVDDVAVVPLIQSCVNLQILYLEQCNITDITLKEIGIHSSHLLHLNVSGCKDITDEGVISVSFKCSKLESLILANCTKLTDCSLQHLPISLLTLDLTGCEGITDAGLSSTFNRCPRLKRLSTFVRNISDSTVSLLSTNCKQICSLRLAGSGALTDESFNLMHQFGITQNLQELTLSACIAVTQQTFIAGRFPCLQILDLTKCLSINDHAVKRIVLECPQLKELNLSSCEDITDAALYSVGEQCKDLQKLNISKCIHISDMGISKLVNKCRFLKNLILYNCNKITDYSIQEIASCCLQLLELDVSCCQLLTDIALQHLGNGCPLLEVLSIEECSFMEAGVSAIAHCYCLKKFKGAYCKGITDCSLKELAGGCPMLNYLDISYCPSLTVVGLQKELPHWRSLKTLHMRGCTQLNCQGFSSPSLEFLNLSWCKNLEDSAIEEICNGCENLVSLDVAWTAKLTVTSLHRLVRSLQYFSFLNVRGCTKLSKLAIKCLSNHGTVTVYT